MKELSAENINLRRLFDEETSCTEPILIIISPGTDPSQELSDLAQNTIGSDKYHQVQPGTLLAVTLLRACVK